MCAARHPSFARGNLAFWGCCGLNHAPGQVPKLRPTYCSGVGLWDDPANTPSPALEGSIRFSSPLLLEPPWGGPSCTVT